MWFTLMDIKFLISLLSISVTLFLAAAVVFISLIYKNNLCHSYRNWQDRDWNPRHLHVSAYEHFNYCKSYLTLSLCISLDMHVIVHSPPQSGYMCNSSHLITLFSAFFFKNEAISDHFNFYELLPTMYNNRFLSYFPAGM